MGIEDLIDRINEASYEGKLRVKNIIESINCKEWESEKSFFKIKFINEKIPEMIEKSSQMATRYYLEIEGNENSEKHIHNGHIDFRPISTTISDAFLPIPESTSSFITCKKSYKSDDPFNPTIITVPYAIPDRDISLCSPSSLWIVLTTLASELGKDYLSLVDINNCLPTGSGSKPIGLKDYATLFEKINLSQHFYIGKKKKEFYNNCEKQIIECENCLSKIYKNEGCILKHFYDLYRKHQKDYETPIMDWRVLYSYIESEIPVYLVFDYDDLKEEIHYKGEPLPNESYHSIVAIGHTLDENGSCSHFIVHDVNHAPFIKISKRMIDENLLEAIVLLPPNTCRFDDALEVLKKTAKIYNEIENILRDSSHIILRPFLMRSQRVKFWYTNKELYSPKICQMYSHADFPKYVWVFEISTPELNKEHQCIGQIIVDANISDTVGLVLVNLPKYRFWYQNKISEDEIMEKPSFKSLPLFRYRNSQS